MKYSISKYTVVSMVFFSVQSPCFMLFVFVLLCLCALCFISSNYIVLYVTLFQCHAWGFISAMELVGYSWVDSSMPLQMVPVGWD